MINATTNNYGWQNTYAHGAEQAYIGGDRYVVYSYIVPQGTAAEPSRYTVRFGADRTGDPPLGVFASREEARAACVAHAVANGGGGDFGPIPQHWDCSGMEPSRHVG